VSRPWLAAIAAIAAAYVTYVGLLVACDLLRVAPLGFRARFEPGAMIVEAVQPDSTAERAGLRVGDRLMRAGDQVIRGAIDWQRVRLHLDPRAPLRIVGERASGAFTVDLPLPPSSTWPALGLLAFRFSQIVTLALAILVASRRPWEGRALLGAWLLAAIATVSLVLPMRLAGFWGAIPQPLSAMLWIPFGSSVAVGPLLFAFFAVFPRQRWPGPQLAVGLLPGAAVVAWHVYSGSVVMRAPGAATGLPEVSIWGLAVNVAYAVGAIALLLSHRRAAPDATDERRTRVLAVGTVAGVAAGVAAVARYSGNPWDDIFANRTLTVFALLFLAMPASFAYAILRHRLFDLRLIVRQGLRYALARRLLDALIPALGVLLVADVLVHRSEPLLTMLRLRWWWYSLVAAALLLARSRREQWVTGLDRRFFREHYDAQRLLGSIAEQINRASSFEAIVPSVVQQLDEAVHPAFVDVLRQVPGTSDFTPAPSPAPGSAGPLPSSLTVIDVLSLLRKPLALSRHDTAWVAEQLPEAERQLLSERGIDLLVPITTGRMGPRPDALLVLGPRRSEEPYSSEDLALLGMIAHALGALLARSPGEPAAVEECGTCGRCYDSGTATCTHDSQRLTIVRGERRVNGRYRLDRRLGRGGMGTVYAATDEALERPVAVKLIREDLAVSPDLDARFRREARAGAAFSHPNVVRVYDFGIDSDGRAFLVMELLEGRTLRQRLISDSPLTAREALHVLRGICPAVAAAHRQGLLHRDLKPENIFLEQHDGAVVPKVLDFGLAKSLRGDAAVTGSGLTDVGVLVGTLEYMSPEQAAGDIASPAWDTWSLGVVAYEMLTGRHPFRREVGALVTPPTNAAPIGSLPASATAFFRTALSTERSDRPKDPMAFLQACEQAFQ